LAELGGISENTHRLGCLRLCVFYVRAKFQAVRRDSLIRFAKSSKQYLRQFVTEGVSFKNESSEAITRRVRSQRRWYALISVCLAVAILGVFLAILESFATQPIPEYTPQFILREERMETTCGGMIIVCPNQNYQPPRPEPIKTEPWIIPKPDRWENQSWDPKVLPFSLDESLEPLEFW
jgi:hypothetical protein